MKGRNTAGKILTLACSVALMAICTGFGYWLGGARFSAAQKKLDNIFGLIANEYVDQVSLDSLVEWTIPALLEHLDPHTAYIPRALTDAANRDMESSFYGVGITYEVLGDTLCVLSVHAGGPAQRQGILPGDRIVAVDSTAVTGGLEAEEILSLFRGPKDSRVTVTVVRAGKPVVLELQRGEIPSASIDASYMLNDSAGYIRIGRFAYNTYAEFLQAIHSLDARGAKSLVLDLRENAGGLVDQAVLVANEFLQPMQAIVETRGRRTDDHSIWRADGTGSFAHMPLVVLVDEYTASASEIVAGAMQDNDRAVIAGRRTFGKGLVQMPVTLPDSSQLRLTVQRYYTPSGRCIQKEYSHADNSGYDQDIVERYNHGEAFSADSVRLDSLNRYYTAMGREVYGGGGIMPDVFVPTDTTGYTSYYFKVANAGLMSRFAFEYADLNRAELSEARDVDGLLAMLPSDNVLLWSFVRYAADNGVPQRWYYINISAKLIVNQLRAMIAKDILGQGAYYQVLNATDDAVGRATGILQQGVGSVIKGPGE